MRSLAKVAMFLAALALMALPAMGQHPVSRGGASGGHTISAPRGFGGHGLSAPGGGSSGRGFSAPHAGVAPRYRGFALRGPMGFRPMPGPRGISSQPGPVRFGSTRLAPGFHQGMSRPLYRGNGYAPEHSHGWDGDRHHHRRGYWGGYGYGYGYPYYSSLIYAGDLDPWLFGPDDFDNSGYDNSGSYAADNYYGGDVPAPYRDYGLQQYASEGYDNSQAAPQASSGRPAYEGQGVTPRKMFEPVREDAVTVIFKDGRPAEQIRNYLLTSTTLTVLDARRRQIPLDDVNVDATVAANRAAGVDFRVPTAQ